MNKNVKPIPEGFHTLTPTITVKSAQKAIEFYKKAFGAVPSHDICTMPDGKVGHMELTIGDSKIMMNEEFPEMGCMAPGKEGSAMGLFLYVKDVDATFKAAVLAGAKALMPVTDQFWGDRHGTVQDPFGYRWSIATHKEDLTPEQIKARMEQAFAAPAGK